MAFTFTVCLCICLSKISGRGEQRWRPGGSKSQKKLGIVTYEGGIGDDYSCYAVECYRKDVDRVDVTVG